MIPILADRFDPEHAFLGKNAYVCVKFSRFNGIGLRHNGSYDPDIIFMKEINEELKKLQAQSNELMTTISKNMEEMGL